jgi:restriction system protein
MLPLLRHAGDGKEHLLANARSRLGAELKLTQTEQDELLPSERQSRLANRVAWARVYLERGGLLESPQRGRFMISPRGREVLNTQPARIDVKFQAHYRGDSTRLRRSPSLAVRLGFLRSRKALSGKRREDSVSTCAEGWLGQVLRRFA